MSSSNERVVFGNEAATTLLEPEMESSDAADNVTAVSPVSCASANVPNQRQCSVQVASLVDNVTSLVDDVIKPHYKSPKVKINDGPSFKPKDRPLDKVYVSLLLLPSHAVENSVSESAAAANFLGSQHTLERFMHAFRQKNECEEQEIELSHLFDDAAEEMQSEDKKGESYRVLVTAGAGTGKTLTFLQLAAMKWARDEIWPEFSIVVAWPMRLPSVQQAKNIVQLLQLEELGIIDPTEQQVIALFVRKYPHKLCVILDGADEADLDKCSDYIQRVIRGELLKGCYLILTSRHSNQILELSASHPFDKHIEVLGFTRENVCEYIGKVLDDSKLRVAVLDKMKANPQIAALLRTPFFSAAICDAVRCHGVVPETMTEVFSMLVLLVIRQNTQQLYPMWSAVPRLFQEQILELGRFLFMMLLENKIVFSENDFYRYGLSADARSTGFLVPCDRLLSSSVCQWQLSHLAIQEFLSALFVAFTCPRPEDITWLVDSVTPDRAHMSTFWCLLAAHLSTDAREALLQGILTKPAGDFQPVDMKRSAEGTSHLDRLLFCTEHELLGLKDVICCNLRPKGLEQLAESLLTGLVKGNVLAAIESSNQDRSGVSQEDFLMAALRLWKRVVPRANASMLHAALETVDTTTAANFSLFLSSQNVSLDTGCGAVPVASREERLKYSKGRELALLLACRVFAVHSCEGGARSNSHSPSLLTVFSQWRRVDLSRFHLTPADCQAIGDVISAHHEAISYIDLQNCGIDDDCYRHLSTGLDQCRKLKKLNLSDNKLTDCHVSHMAKVVQQNCTSLEHFDTSRNDITVEGYTRLYSTTHMCSKLQDLSVRPRSKFNSCTPELYDAWLQTIVRILTSCRQLRTVWLNRCIPGDTGLAVLQPALVQLPLLEELILRDNSITDNSSQLLNSIIQSHQQRLLSLDLSSNPLGDSGLVDMHVSIRQCRRLEWLWLGDTNLTAASLSTLGDLLPCLPNLWGVHLSNNDFRGEDTDVESFAIAVRALTVKLFFVMPKKSLCSQTLLDHLPAGGTAHVEYDDE